MRMFVATADNIYEKGEVGRGSKIKKEVGEKKNKKIVHNSIDGIRESRQTNYL